MKNLILTPNPYRDKNFHTLRCAMQILKDAGDMRDDQDRPLGAPEAVNALGDGTHGVDIKAGIRLIQDGQLGAAWVGGVVALLAVGLGAGCGLEWALPWLAMQRRRSILILRQC